MSTLSAGEVAPGRDAARMGVVAGVSRLLGAVRIFVVAAVLGTTALGDTFQASNSVSNVLFELLAAGALSAVLVPTFVELLERRSQRDAEEVAGGVLGLAVCALAVVVVVGVALAPQIATLLTASVDDPDVAAEQQALATTLLRFFVPQVALYGIGTVATAVLHARGRFLAAAAAPIGNTVVLVAAMGLFRALAGPEPTLDLTTGEQVVLGLGGTLGVAAFVAVPVIALRGSGFRARWRVRRAWADERVRRLLRLSGWTVLQHAAGGLLLAGALVVGAGVPGGVVAYQAAWVVFLAPYGVLAQPILTTILPVMARATAAGDHAALGRSLRWSVESMATVTLPVSAACVALALPIMAVLAFGRATAGDGVELLAAALASLAVGQFPYATFLLLSRAWYALGDSRTPAVAGVVTALVGVVVMVAVGSRTEGAGRLVVLGAGHSVAYALGAVWLAVGARRRIGAFPVIAVARTTTVAAAVGALAWLGMDVWDPDGRVATLVALAVVAAVGGGAYLLAVRGAGWWPRPWSAVAAPGVVR